MEKITFDVSLDGAKKDSITTDKNGITELIIPLQDETGKNRTATETYLLRETNVPTGYVDTGDVQITVEIANGAFKIAEAKLVDRKAGENQEAVIAPTDRWQGSINTTGRYKSEYPKLFQNKQPAYKKDVGEQKRCIDGKAGKNTLVPRWNFYRTRVPSE